MPLIALLSARNGARDRAAAGAPGSLSAPGPLIAFGGPPLIEYQARIAIAAGAQHVLIQVDATTPDLTQLVDRLTEERQATIALFHDMTTLSRGLSPGDRILLVAENLIVPAEAIATLLESDAPAILALPAVPATAAFERIDGEAVWAGALTLSGEALLTTIDMLGEWDLALTLLRRTVQDGAGRVRLSPELVMDGRLAVAHDQQSADLALAALADQDRAGTVGLPPGLGGLLAPLVRPLVRELVRRQVEPARLTAIALALGAAGIALAVLGWSIPAVLLALAGQGASDLARQCADLTLRPLGPLSRHRVVQAIGLGVLAIIGWRLADHDILALAGAWLPLLLTGILSSAAEERPFSGIWSNWPRLTAPIALLLVLLGLVLGYPGPAFAVLGVAAVAIVAARLLPFGRSRV